MVDNQEEEEDESEDEENYLEETKGLERESAQDRPLMDNTIDFDKVFGNNQKDSIRLDLKSNDMRKKLDELCKECDGRIEDVKGGELWVYHLI